MTTDSKIPQIASLRLAVETEFGSPLKVHSDFVNLRDDIFSRFREHISESTLERLWSYSTRLTTNASLRTLNVLSRYAGKENWDKFCEWLKEVNKSESDIFDVPSIQTTELKEGDRLLIGWLPDRQCIIRYLGSNMFVAEETVNSQLQPGDTFSCFQLQLHQPLYLENLVSAIGEKRGNRYGIGLRNGLVMLQILP